MNGPEPQFQVEFLANVQRLLSEGSFVASYKFALLLALADLAVEHGDDRGAALDLTARQLADKFIHYYWRQATPYLTPRSPDGVVLAQNTGRQAAILTKIQAVRANTPELSAYRRSKDWPRLLDEVAGVVKVMPLWKLQTVGSGTLDFLYENVGRGSVITLRPGVAACLRKFHLLLGDLVRGAWVRYVRRFNEVELGEVNDLHEFLFGSERRSLQAVVPVLRDVQGGECFYCGKALGAQTTHVDHFIPWSRYPVDLGHNFVLAHDRPCNSAKSDRLASGEHLRRWTERNLTHADALRQEFDRRAVIHDLPTSIAIARWAYRQLSGTHGTVWLAGDRLVPLDAGWERWLVG